MSRARVGLRAIAVEDDDQCEERPSDEGNAADELEHDYWRWLQVGHKPSMLRVAGMAHRKPMSDARRPAKHEMEGRLIFPSPQGKRVRAVAHHVGAVHVPLELLAEVGTNMPDADFWLVRVGSASTVGTPTRTYYAENIGIRVLRTDLVNPDFLFYAMQYAHQRGNWHGLTKGSTNRKSITVGDVKKILFSL